MLILDRILDMENKQPVEPEKIEIEEAARILKISVGTLRRRVKDKIVPTVPISPLLKQPKQTLFYKSDVEKLAKGE